MATKRVCDRCRAEINQPNSVIYAGIWRKQNRTQKMDGGDNNAAD